MAKDFEMHRSQGYVFGIGSRLGISVKMDFHDYQTRSCSAKANLLSDKYGEEWPLDRVVKALYFNPPGSPPDHFVGVITPEVDLPIDFGGLCSQVDALNGIPHSKYFPGSMPRGMSNGTCTPFPNDYLVDEKSRVGRIIALLVCDYPRLDDQVVDISVGGNSPEARMASMHLPYSGIHRILSERFPNTVFKVAPSYKDSA